MITSDERKTRNSRFLDSQCMALSPDICTIVPTEELVSGIVWQKEFESERALELTYGMTARIGSKSLISRHYSYATIDVRNDTTNRFKTVLKYIGFKDFLLIRIVINIGVFGVGQAVSGVCARYRLFGQIPERSVNALDLTQIERRLRHYVALRASLLQVVEESARDLTSA